MCCCALNFALSSFYVLIIFVKMFHVCLSFAALSVLAALWSAAGKGLSSWLSCVLYFLVFCHFPICVLIDPLKGKFGAVKHV